MPRSRATNHWVQSFHEQIVAISTRPSTRHIEDNLATFLLHSSLRAVDKTARRVEAEVVSACMGGIGSIALVLTIASFYIMRDPEVKRQLHDCLRALPLDAFTNEFAHVRDLFKSTYLSACGLEALRYVISLVLWAMNLWSKPWAWYPGLLTAMRGRRFDISRAENTERRK